MDYLTAKKLNYSSVRSRYKDYLLQQELGRNTISTITSDSLYLWNNASNDIFWATVFSEDFDTTAPEEVKKALKAKSSGNVDNLVNGYVANLRRFRDFIFNLSNEDLQSDENALKDFLMEIDCLDPLDEWTRQFNLFDILKISRTEIRHSNMLAWLLTPNENHGLGDSVIRGFLQYGIDNYCDNSDVFDVLLMDTFDFQIQREWHNIDILAVAPNQSFVICIENKIDSGEHDNQLERYKKIVEDTYPSYKKLFIYLSPDGTDATDTDNWCSMGYQDVLQIIEKTKKKTQLLPEAELLIDNYINTIRRDIVGDEKLAQICAEIYAKHKKALDLIFENKPDKASDLAEILCNWARAKTQAGELEFVAEKSSKTYTRFKTKYMSELLPEAKDALSGWNTHSYYYYEIRNDGGTSFFIKLAFSSKDIPDELRAKCNEINKHFPSKTQKENWQWRIHFTSKKTKLDEDAEITEESICELLDKKFEEVKAFEAKLNTALSKEIVS